MAESASMALVIGEGSNLRIRCDGRQLVRSDSHIKLEMRACHWTENTKPENQWFQGGYKTAIVELYSYKHLKTRMNEAISTQSVTACKNCGGQSWFVPKETALQCRSCGTKTFFEETDPKIGAIEKQLVSDEKNSDRERISYTKTHSCEACGAKIRIPQSTLATECHYCNSPIVLKDQDSAFPTTAIVPFALDRMEAERQISNWVLKNIEPMQLDPSFFKSGGLLKLLRTGRATQFIKRGRLSGVYVPYWTFDSSEQITYLATIYKTEYGTRTTYQKSGQGKLQFSDVLIAGTKNISPWIDYVLKEDFDPERLKVFHEAYLAGFLAEHHHMTIIEALKPKLKHKYSQIKQTIVDQINAAEVVVDKFNTKTTDERYLRILLPVWIFHFENQGLDRTVVVSGINGAVAGDVPELEFQENWPVKIAIVMFILMGLIAVINNL